jgi:hypothetical protein
VSHTGADDYIVRTQATADDLGRLPRLERWPVLAAPAFHGPAGEIVERVAPYSEADPVATLLNLLAALGNVVGPEPHARVQHDRHALRLNIALVGETGKARKGLSWSTPAHLLGHVDAEWLARRVVTGLSSGEGLIYHVRDEREERQPIREKGRVIDYQSVVVDEGVRDKRLFVVEPELASVLKVMNRETNTLSPIIRSAWDSGNLATLTKNNPLRATGAHISIVGHITREELRRELSATECANGFANRFLWLLVRRSKYLPEGAAIPEEQLFPFIAQFQRVIAFARSVGEIRRDNDARTIWAGVYPSLSAGEPGLVGAILGRAEAQVLRLSCLYALLDESAFVTPTHLKAALAIWDYAAASVRVIYGDALGWPVADTILASLRTRGSMTRTEISDLFGRHHPAADLDSALAQLQAAGRARGSKRDTGGRPAVVWEPQ